MNKIKLSRRFTSWLLIVVFLLAGISGCGDSKTDVAKDSQPNTQIIRDCAGRTVEIPKSAQRIACITPDAGHVLAMLGAGDRIVAVVDGLKRDVLMTNMYPKIQNLPVPKVNGLINIEELARTQPDLIIIKDETARNERELDKLDKIQVPYLVMQYNTMAQQQQAIDMIGKAVGREKRAEEYIAYYRTSVERVTSVIQNIPESERVTVYHSVNEATRTDEKNTLPADLTGAAGALNVSAAQDLKLYEGKYYASLEQIMLWDPQVILVNEPDVVGYITTNPQWQTLQAVKTKRVYPLPNGISRWGHPSSVETPLAVMWTAKLLYPSKFKNIDMMSETKKFYKQFFGYTISDKTVNQILSGVGMRLDRNRQTNGDS